MSNILASMTISLGASTEKFVSGMKNAATHLTKFQQNADQLKGIDLSKMTADFSRQITPLTRLQSEARKLGTQIRLATDEKTVKKLNAELERTQAEMARIRTLGRTGLTGVTTSANGAARGMGKLAGSAGTVNMEFARIIQDAPYGMQGIGNNIQQLTSNFGQLAAQAGGSGAAIKATLASMITPASLLTLGIAAVTAGWIAYEKWAQKSAKASKEAESAMTSTKKASEEYRATLDTLTRARLEGAQDAQQEVTSLKILYKQTQNTTLSLKDRLKAVKDIQKEYPSYFAGFSKEEILAGKAKDAYDKLSRSIIATGRARAAQEMIADKSRQQLENEQKIADLKRQEQQQQAKAAKNQEALAKVQAKLRASGDNSQAGADALLRARAEKEINGVVGERQKLELENITIGEEMLRLEKEIFRLIQDGADLTKNDDDKKEKDKLTALQELEKAFNQANREAQVFGDYQEAAADKVKALQNAISRLLAEGISPQSAQIQALKTELEGLNNIDLSNLSNTFENFANSSVTALERVNGRLDAFQAKTISVNSAMSDSFLRKMADEIINYGPGIVQGIESIAFAAGDALGSMFAGVASGTEAIKQFGRGVLAAMADFAASFGKQLVALGTAKVGLDKLFAAPGAGPFAIAAGLALMTAAGALSASLKGGPNFGGGPSVSAGVSGNFTPQYSGSGSKEVIFKLHGRELRGLMENEGYYKGRIGG